MDLVSAVAARAEFLRLREGGALTPSDTARLGREAARACLASEEQFDESARLLCELATLSDPELARGGVEGIFRHAVEGMADAFELRFCDLYIQFFARVIESCRPAAWLDQRLRHFGLHQEQDLIRRALKLRRPRRAAGPVKKILVLSRVTLGAEVAITSVVLARMMRTFPEARLVLLAGPKSAQLFAGEGRLTARPAEYPRGGGLLERLAAWPPVVDRVHEEIEGLRPGEYLVADPDSRLTQLGMLPLLADESAYLFFESRSYSKPGIETLSELTAAWANETFGGDPATLHPWVSLPLDAVQFAQFVRAAAPQARWVSVNLGVGDNPAKRIQDPFEQRLLDELLRSGWRIFLDKGEGEEEAERVDRLLSFLRDTGWRVAEIVESAGLPAADSQVAAWRGSLAGFGALIGVSDLYIGYDSAGQHVAAALGIKTIDIFAGFRWPRMAQRWRPAGTGVVRQIVADTHLAKEPEKVLAAVLEAAR
ncbi:MAG: hypothetical protein HY236_13930 [Acidobacteria bacterium]|nr:hypothetical protein [Acidobacteriota bacterium]